LSNKAIYNVRRSKHVYMTEPAEEAGSEAPILSPAVTVLAAAVDGIPVLDFDCHSGIRSGLHADRKVRKK